MKWLKYTYRTIVSEGFDKDGNPVEVEVLTAMRVPATDAGRALAEKESYDGIIEDFDDGEPEVNAVTLEDRVQALERAAVVPEYVPGKWYYRGDKVSADGINYTCVAPAGVVCVWSPTEYPDYWQKEE